MLGLIELWIVIGVTIFLTIVIPVVVLRIRWKVSSPRRGGKRNISIHLEKMEVRRPSKVTSGSFSIPDTVGGEIHIINNINIDGRRRHHHENQNQRIDEQHPLSLQMTLNHCLSITRHGCLRISHGCTKTGMEDRFRGRNGISFLIFHLCYICGVLDPITDW